MNLKLYKILAGGAAMLAAGALSAQSFSFALVDPLPGISPTLTFFPINLGLADTHSHQMSVHGFGGGFIWGDPHTTNRKTALKACDGGDHGFPQNFEAAMLTYLGIGRSNKVMAEEVPARKKYCDGYTGDGNGYTGFPIWGSMVKQQLSQPDLKKAHDQGDLNVLVMSAVSFQPLCDYLPTKNRKYYSYYYKAEDTAYGKGAYKSYTCNEHDNIMAQINFALDYEAANSSWYKIARSAQEAEDAILQGKLAVVLHIETTYLFQSGTQQSDPNLNTMLRWVYDKGVRSIQLTHELDSWVGGAAYWGTTPLMARLANCMDKKKDSNPFNNCIVVALASQGDYKMDLDSNDRNKLGLTTKGKYLVRSMYNSCMIPDLAHASDKTFADARAVSREGANNYPLFVSHTPAIASLANYDQDDEYQSTDTEIRQVRDSGGVVGLRTAPYQMKKHSSSGVSNTCHGSTRSFIQTLSKADELGVNVAMAYDMSGMAQNLGPRFRATGTKWENLSESDDWVCPQGGTPDSNRNVNGTGTNYDYIGLAHIGMTGDMMTDIQKLGYTATNLKDGANNFIEMWRGIEDANPYSSCAYRYRTSPLN